MPERRRVNFDESPPSSGTSSRYTSESVSDYPGSSAAGGGGVASSSTTSSRYSSAGSGINQWTDLPALQDAYRNVLDEREEWQSHNEDLREQLIRAQKKSAESHAKWVAMAERNEQLEEDNKKLVKDKNSLACLVDDLNDKVDELREELAIANARFNEIQLNMTAPAYGSGGGSNSLGTSPHSIHSGDISHGQHGLGQGHSSDPNKPAASSSNRHSRDGKVSSASTNSSSTGSGTGSSGSSSHGSSRAKVGSSSSTSTAKVSRQGSKHDKHHHEKEQKIRLSQRFEHHKDDGIFNDGNTSGPSSAASASSASNKHHKSGSSGNGSSGSNGSSASVDSGVGGVGGVVGISSGAGRPVQLPQRARRQSYVEGFGPGAVQPPVSPNKAIPRSAAAVVPMGGVVPPSVIVGANGQPPASTYYGHGAPAYRPGPPPQPHSALVSPRGDAMGRDPRELRDPRYEPYQDPYFGATSTRDPRDPRLPRR